MFIVTCIFLFFLLNWKGVNYLVCQRSWPLYFSWEKEKSAITISGAEKFILLTLLCAPCAVSFGGLVAMRLAGWIALCVLAFLIISRSPSRSQGVSWVALFYCCYLLWLIIGIVYSPSPLMGFRVFLKYLFPFLIMQLAIKYVNNSHIFKPAVFYCFIMLCISNIVLCFFPLIGLGFVFQVIAGVFHFGAGIIDAGGVLAACSFLLYQEYKKKRYLLGLLLAVAFPVIWSVRTGILSIAVTCIAMLFFKFRLKFLPFLLVPVCIGGMILLKLPQMQEKMFYDPGKFATMGMLETVNSINWSDIDSSGRFALWERMLEMFYEPNIITGSGSGSTQDLLYWENKRYGTLPVVHNDYVQILCDNGNIGFILYLCIFLMFEISCFKLYSVKNLSSESRKAALLAGSSFAGLAVCMITDNVVNYSMTTLVYPFTFYGIAKALERYEIQRNYSFIQ